MPDTPIITSSPAGSFLILQHPGYEDLEFVLPYGIFMWGGHFTLEDIGFTLYRDRAIIQTSDRIYWMPRATLAAVAQGRVKLCKPQFLIGDRIGADTNQQHSLKGWI
ncbi:MAG: hypothetical protein Q7J09_10490 [Methanocalculus sp.]|uniref:hypothetical protein n=1 Tax=Methanocalculus sp. TaxID=2004547 RepID=UPI00272569BD|nr:hypothetical protein [Methanocalculus sp.]MDO9540412.1 hypothetical protein [Methanocalculus sp.]